MSGPNNGRCMNALHLDTPAVYVDVDVLEE
jgi:hypothetical protein